MVATGNYTDFKNKSLQSLSEDLIDSRIKKKYKRHLLFITAIMFIIMSMILFYINLGADKSRYDYITENVKQGDIEVIVTATGSLAPTKEVSISSELSGKVLEVYVEADDIVHVGQVIAQIDTQKIQADVHAMRAKLNQAAANLLKSQLDAQLTKKKLNRRKELMQTQNISKEDLDISQYAYDEAVALERANKATVQAAQADLKLSEINLNKTRIISPINGMVLQRNVDPGAIVAASLSAPTLFSIASDLKYMQLEAAIDEADVGTIKKGQKAHFTVAAYPKIRFPAVINAVHYSATTVSNVVTYQAIFSVDNSALLLRPGMTATADITINKVQNKLLIPNAALRYNLPESAKTKNTSFWKKLLIMPRRPSNNQGLVRSSDDKKSVWMLIDNHPKNVFIKTGATDGFFTVVEEGDLKKGDAVIVDNTLEKS
ncbi:Macrolide-specific efflux protein MacA [Liberibacter crescens BT-1]|uniref:Macrolide-specific efflux protein MacA n=1 Tax=Liberibacter crescens (strain BT-1) TaxID=1215343 RepID=L0EUP7_LIBCB|nr:efflux RND transporter periplasmic adaptor subunit [Liberibacter crescens]AGA64555.1 Macrolide-specific efflux protein MacA [Liberibacter crescens BT-1]AMC12698.1 hypothetical protein RL73_02935 [Liberibacter crescens]